MWTGVPAAQGGRRGSLLDVAERASAVVAEHYWRDTGPDDANHAQDGLWIAAGPGVDARGRVDAHLLDIAPTVLELLEVEQPDGMRGTSLASTLARA